jgi:radical SAM protein with 4Fe4S-binding SPASM domain
MTIKTAKSVIDWIFDNIPNDMDGVEINLIGGEPLLEFDLIKSMVEYTSTKKPKDRYLFYATTNGTLLTEEMKLWFTQNKACFWLGLSLDGAKETHDHNRCNSFNKIDINFFRNTWPGQSVKMTLSDFSLSYLAKDIKYIHSLGFPIRGVNEFEGDFDWDHDKYIKALVPQLKELVEYYVENDTIPINQLLDMKLHYCESKTKERKKWCGIGDGAIFFDVDGKIYPCNYITPMTFSDNEIGKLLEIDYKDINNFIDEECYNNCYIYAICPTCTAACYKINGTFKQRTKSRCRTQRLLALFAADLQAKLIIKNKGSFDESVLYYTIEAIKNIRYLYLKEFKPYL